MDHLGQQLSLPLPNSSHSFLMTCPCDRRVPHFADGKTEAGRAVQEGWDRPGLSRTCLSGHGLQGTSSRSLGPWLLCLAGVWGSPGEKLSLRDTQGPVGSLTSCVTVAFCSWVSPLPSHGASVASPGAGTTGHVFSRMCGAAGSRASSLDKEPRGARRHFCRFTGVWLPRA